MSNPAVFELAAADIAGQRVCLEDNIGESIHLHIGLVRADMTVKEFRDAALKMQKALNTLTPNFFDVAEYDAYFLERLGADIINISAVEEIILPLKDLRFCFEGDGDEIFTVNITESPEFKYYGGAKKILEQFENKGDIFQSNSARADKVFAAIQTAPAENFILCADAENKILDGRLTAAALARLYGTNKKVKVKRFHFETSQVSAVVRRRNKRLW